MNRQDKNPVTAYIIKDGQRYGKGKICLFPVFSGKKSGRSGLDLKNVPEKSLKNRHFAQ